MDLSKIFYLAIEIRIKHIENNLEMILNSVLSDSSEL